MGKLGLGLAIAFFTTALSFTGCMAPCGSCGPCGAGIGPIGPGCATSNCSDCDGSSVSTQYIARGPIDALRNARRRMVCGSGCGEVYMGEWISSPPNVADPCCGGQFVGGATSCRPFCGQPNLLAGLRGLYGQRFCSGAQSSAPCACGNNFCDGGCGAATTVYAQPVVSSPVVSSPVISAPAASGCGCASCSAKGNATQTRVVTNNTQPAADMATATQRKVVAQQQTTVRKAAQQAVR